MWFGSSQAHNRRGQLQADQPNNNNNNEDGCNDDKQDHQTDQRHNMTASDQQQQTNNSTARPASILQIPTTTISPTAATTTTTTPGSHVGSAVGVGVVGATQPQQASTPSGSLSPSPQPAHNKSSSSSSSSQSTNSASTTTSRPASETVSFHLKSSIFTRLVTIDSDKMALGLVKQLAIAFVNEIYFQYQYPNNTYIGDYLKKHYSTNDNISQLYDRIILRVYNPSQDSFVPFYSVGDIQSDSYVSIEFSERKPVAQQQSVAHHHHHHHHHYNQQQQQNVLTAASGSGHSPTSPSGATGGGGSMQQQTLLVNNGNTSNSPNNDNGNFLHTTHQLSCSVSQYQLKISHDFHTTTYIKPTYCASCSALIIGVYKQGFQCSYCKKNYCPKCKNKADVSGEGCLALAPAPPLTPTTLGPPLSATFAVTNASATATAAASPTNTTNSTSNLSILSLTKHHQQHQPSDSSTSTTSGSSSNKTTQSSSNSHQHQNSNTPHNQHQANNSEKLDTSHVNMSKRKSASNLLHFNIANPFKSHHATAASNTTAASSTSQQTGQQSLLASSHRQHQSKDEMSSQPSSSRATSKSVRSSVGALDMILQQLSRQKDQQSSQNKQQVVLAPAAAPAPEPHLAKNQSSQQPQADKQQCSDTKTTSSSKLLNVTPIQQLSSSHQNLYTISDREQELLAGDGGNTTQSGSSSARQSPTKEVPHQLSNSARNSARDISHGTSPTRRDMVTNHDFISMDWIQVYGEPNCGVCNKLLKGSTTSAAAATAAVCNTNRQQPAAMCKTCKLQVHAQCQDLALADCLSRITESSRAAGRQRSRSPEGDDLERTDGHDSSAVRSTNSNVSRDNIRLHRLAPSVKHVKRPDLTKPIIEGWLQHKTLSDEQPRRHYWRLDDTDITLYESDTSPRYFKAIALNKITRVISAGSLPKQIKEDAVLGSNKSPEHQLSRSAQTSPTKTSEFKAQMAAMFAFEVTTGSVYLVQANDQVEANKWRGSLETITAKLASDESDRARQSSKLEQQQQDASAVVASATKTSPEHQSKSESHLQEVTNKDNENRDSATRNELTGSQLDPATAGKHLASVAEDSNVASSENDASNSKQTPPSDGSKPRRHHHHNHHHHHQHHHHNQLQQSGAANRGGLGTAPIRSVGQQHKTYTDPKRSRLYNRPRIIIKLDPMSIPDHWIEGKYLIERNRTKGTGFEELGSGQFGKVYAAISEIKAEDTSKGLWSGVPVAIKEISKARFDLKQQAKLKNEANILSRLDHPGVIILERVHDLPDKLYIVMEQLEDDMLEMIVSTEEKRLSERVTKFLTYQILEALKYLHSQNIAHCDLKPENVLLCEQRSQFPQIKLCDFGFAKIIEENSFRSSLVGTPAYLAPEVVKGERYNRSVDLWSVGVIIYVSLSGEFPFNEGENIHDQISRANFMYPEQPWAKVSQQAKSFINSLLRVNCDKRLSASRAQMDTWIQDYQLWCDLCELELRVGRRWVTDDADYSRWSQYAKQHQLQVPRAAVQLHQDLSSE